MNYYLIAFIWLTSIAIVYGFLRSNYADRATVVVRNGISFFILLIPLMLLFLKIDRLYQIFGEMSVLVKGLSIAAILISINIVVYRVIYHFVIRKRRT